MVSWIAVLAAFLAGMALGRVPFRPGRRRVPGPPGPRRSQLLRWIDAAPGGWLLLDAADTIQLINPRAERLLQIPGASLPLQEPLQSLCPAPELREVIHNARRRGRAQRLEWQVGDQELEVFALPGEAGWVAVLLQSRRSLEAQLEQQERWVSDVAHELKTPLTALLLVGDSLAAQVNSRNAVLVERLQRELLRLQQLVGDLLELSRLQNTLPGAVPAPVEVDLARLVEQVWAGLRPLADERGIQLVLEVEDAPIPDAPAARATAAIPGTPAAGAIPAPDPGPAPPVRVLGDASRLHRAVLNLLDNALRYSPDQGTLRVRLEGGPQWCLLAVRDEGPGLSEEDLEHMFERFYRGDPSRVRSRRGGSGLGLSIVQQIVVTHGGRVQAANHPAGGAVVELLLPQVG